VCWVESGRTPRASLTLINTGALGGESKGDGRRRGERGTKEGVEVVKGGDKGRSHTLVVWC
jgi:hypothetical protein